MIPPARILAAVDFSEPSRVALTFAARLARQCGAELHITHGQEPLLVTAAREKGLEVSEEANEELRAFTYSSWPAGDCSPSYHIVVGADADAILDVAQQESADLVVVGARGMSAVERLFFGSTTEGLLRRADIPVLVVPDLWRPPVPESAGLSGVGPVICGIDTTMLASEAARASSRLAALLHTELVLVHVVPAVRILERWRAQTESATASRLDTARRELGRVVTELTATAPTSSRVETGQVAQWLAHIATMSHRSLLVLGRGIPGHGSGTPGSIAYRALMLSQAPLLMYPTQG